MVKFLMKYFWVIPKRYFNNVGYLYCFAIFCILAKLLINSSLAPEWLSRLVFSYLLLVLPIPFLLWKGLGPTSGVVTKQLLKTERKNEKWIMSVCARIIFSGIATVLIWSTVLVTEDIGDLIKYGDKSLVRERAVIKDVHAQGITGFLYRIIYFAGEADSHDELMSMSSVYGLWPNSTWDFVLLKNSGMILEIKPPDFPLK